MKQRIITVIAVIIAVLAVIAALYAWFHQKEQAPITVYAPAKVEPKVEKVPKTEVIIKHVHVYEKEKVSEALGLPESIKKDANKQVIADAEIQPYEGKTSAVTVIDTASGDAEIIVKQKPLPLFDLKNDKEIGARILASTAGNPEGHLYGRWTFLRSGSIHWAGYGELRASEASTELLGGLDMSYRW